MHFLYVFSKKISQDYQYLRIARSTMESLKNENGELKEKVKALEDNPNSSLLSSKIFTKFSENYEVSLRIVFLTLYYLKSIK